ncbi:MAG: UvrB/UvrC motif-containing protein [Planctomycetes bacterium]|nr:UvrB/UvrC motif-containing protein [Planctomycetota bacterium]
MKDARGRTLYIGKAKNLRNRVSGYFQAGAPDPRVDSMVAQVRDVEWIDLPSEVDALLAEARLIKDVQPKYNVQLKDDKSFAVLAITRFDDFPKVWVVRQTDSLRAETWGPFTQGADVREAVKILQRIFKFATCRIEMRADDGKRRFFRPCLLHAIRRCTAPCADLVSKEEYGRDIESLRRFLRGDRDGLLAEMRSEMKEASTRLEFERAAELRDRIRALENLGKAGSGTEYIEGDITPMDPKEGIDDLVRALSLDFRPRTIEGVDIAHVQGGESVGSLVCFVDGIPFKSGYRRYRIREVRGIDDFAMIAEVVRRRFRRQESPPDVLLIDGGPGQYNAARAAGANARVLLSLAKREETLFRDGRPLELERSTPAMRLLMYVRDEAHRFAQHYHHLLRRKAVLGES